MKAAPIIGKKAVEAGRYYASEAMRNPKLQKKAIDFALDKLNPMIQNIGSQAINQLSTKIRPKKKYKTNRKDLDGGALARRRGPSSVDKAAYIMSNLLTPTPSFAGLAKVVAGQAFKGVKDNFNYYRGNGITDSLLTSRVKGSPLQVDKKKELNCLQVPSYGLLSIKCLLLMLKSLFSIIRINIKKQSRMVTLNLIILW